MAPGIRTLTYLLIYLIEIWSAVTWWPWLLSCMYNLLVISLKLCPYITLENINTPNLAKCVQFKLFMEAYISGNFLTQCIITNMYCSGHEQQSRNYITIEVIWLHSALMFWNSTFCLTSVVLMLDYDVKCGVWHCNNTKAQSINFRTVIFVFLLSLFSTSIVQFNANNVHIAYCLISCIELHDC